VPIGATLSPLRGWSDRGRHSSRGSRPWLHTAAPPGLPLTWCMLNLAVRSRVRYGPRSLGEWTKLRDHFSAFAKKPHQISGIPASPSHPDARSRLAPRAMRYCTNVVIEVTSMRYPQNRPNARTNRGMVEDARSRQEPGVREMEREGRKTESGGQPYTALPSPLATLHQECGKIRAPSVT